MSGMSSYKLFGRAGWGSVLTETQLAWYGLPYEFEEVGDLFKSVEARAALAKVNPLAQLPTLVLPDGQVMTESAAITLHLADATGRADLVPTPTDQTRPAFLRWLVFLVANVYPTFTYGDDPARFVPDPEFGKLFRANVDAYARKLWAIVDRAAGEPWFLGERFSALDIYVGGMTRWRPGLDWFAMEHLKLHAIARRVEAEPRLAAVWARNFPAK
jgi:GST-like protein